MQKSRRKFTSKTIQAEPILFWSWVVWLCWLPIPLASNRSWSWALLEVGIFILLGAWCVAYLRGKVELSTSFLRARGVIALMLIWLMYQALYLVPMPLSWIAVLSPETARVHELTAGFVPNAWRTLSLDIYQAQVSWLKSLAYVFSFLLTLLVVTSRDRLRQLAYALVIWGLVLSIYGLLMHLTDITQHWLETTIFHGQQASATFANRNHFANYLVMILSIGVGILIAGLRDQKAQTWKQFFRHLLEWVFSTKILVRLSLCILVIALVATHSRMGNTAFFAALMITGVIGLALSRHATRGTVILLTSLIVIDIFIVGSWFGVEKLADRIQQTTIVKQASPSGIPNAQDSIEERFDPSSEALKLIADFPAFGTGPGSWYVTFPRYRTAAFARFFDDAHNDYVQFAAESGLIGLSLLAMIVLWSMVTALIAHYQRRDPLMRGMSFAAIMGMVAMLIHVTVEFNFQIPANAVMFMVILALAWISGHLDRRRP